MEIKDSIESALRQRLEAVRVEVEDDSPLHQGHAGAAGGGGHFRVKVVSEQFHNKTRLERHRMVYAALQEYIPSSIHALSVHALTPEEENR